MEDGHVFFLMCVTVFSAPAGYRVKELPVEGKKKTAKKSNV